MSAEKQEGLEIERRLERDSVSSSTPVPPAGLADEIKAAIPHDLFPALPNEPGSAQGVGASSSPVKKPVSIQRWAIAASILAAVLVGVLALRMGIRSPLPASEPEAQATVAGPADESAQEDASDLLDSPEASRRKQSASPVEAADRQLEAKLKQASEEAVARSNDQTAIPVPPAESAPAPASAPVEGVGESSLAEADRYVVSESMAVTAEAEDAAGAREDRAQLPASPKRARGRLERAALPELEGWVDLFLAQSSRDRDAVLKDEAPAEGGFADRAELNSSRKVFAGRSAVVSFVCPDSASADGLYSALVARQENDRAMKAGEPSGDPLTIELREFRVWTRESLLERLQELQLLSGEFSCTLAFLESESSTD
jgi:hypothetical protein